MAIKKLTSKRTGTRTGTVAKKRRAAASSKTDRTGTVAKKRRAAAASNRNSSSGAVNDSRNW